jgi:signal transduction histidine kinase
LPLWQVTVTASLQPGRQSDRNLAIEVRDNGPGLPAAAIPHVFDRFYKADSARTRSEGSGLGLAIAMENAWLHGGHIDTGNHLMAARYSLLFCPSARVFRQLCRTGQNLPSST